MELEFEELFELQLDDEFELEFEELLDELFDEEFEDEFELELPATLVRSASSVAFTLPADPRISASDVGVAAWVAPTERAAVARPASDVILTVRFMCTFSFAYAAAP